ncbi:MULTISPECIES: AAA family ATPase [unclassified Frankia]|uniref:AAA family ATPase n=1 Tax=unclassified Frankia TaxID=2632575 RepID=UPI0020246B44
MTSRLSRSPGGYGLRLPNRRVTLRASASGPGPTDARRTGHSATGRDTTGRDVCALGRPGPPHAGDPSGDPSGAGWTLRYPAGTVLIVAGIPGAGKSTLIRHVFGDITDPGPKPSPEPGSDPRARTRGARPLILDSADIRTALRARLGPRLPYRLYRPAVHIAHYARIAWMTARHGESLVVHECGTRRWARRAITGLARARHRPAHLILIDAPSADALAGQRARGRTVRSRAFRRHERSWARLRAAGPAALYREGWSSARVLDRRDARTLNAIRFG